MNIHLFRTKIKFCILIIALMNTSAALAEVYYLSIEGSDSNTGSIESPLASMAAAQDLVSAGDTVYIRGGLYQFTNDDISTVYSNLFACYAFLDKSGTEGNRINYWTYPGEQAVFDFSSVKPAGKRVVGFFVQADYIHIKGIEITGVQVVITTHTESYCIYSWGNHNIFEGLSFHDNQGTGLRHRKGGYNLFLNCDSYRNHDYTSEDGRGGNTDGFGCHPDAGGKGNVFRGCRSWFNSDDGYDFIGSAEVVTIENSWAMYNGYSTSFKSLADGNGFKAGGDAVTPVEDLPNPIPRHEVRFCLAVRNKASGFYANHHIGGINWFNNSAYKNSHNYNMLNRLDDNVTDVPGYGHTMYNNLGFLGGNELRNIAKEDCELSNNYFDLDVLVSAEDFKSLDMSLLTQDRQADGSLPDTDFMKLRRGSDLVDKGKDIGYVFSGYGPDLGAWEQGYIDFPSSNTFWYLYYTPDYYWEPGNEAHYRIYGLLWEDTLINNLKYQRIYRFKDDRLNPELAEYAGAIRKDSLRRVFYRGKDLFPSTISDTGDVLLYDFSACVGDTIMQNAFADEKGLIVSKIDTVFIGEELRPRIHFGNDPYTKWIEGIGGVHGILFFPEEYLAHGVWSELVCLKQDDIFLYHNADFEECYEDVTIDVSIVPKSELALFYPNPVGDILNIHFECDRSIQAKVINTLGLVCIDLELEANEEQSIDVGLLATGLYIFQYERDGELQAHRFIKY